MIPSHARNPDSARSARVTGTASAHTAIQLSLLLIHVLVLLLWLQFWWGMDPTRVRALYHESRPTSVWRARDTNT